MDFPASKLLGKRVFYQLSTQGMAWSHALSIDFKTLIDFFRSRIMKEAYWFFGSFPKAIKLANKR